MILEALWIIIESYFNIQFIYKIDFIELTTYSSKPQKYSTWNSKSFPFPQLHSCIIILPNKTIFQLQTNDQWTENKKKYRFFKWTRIINDSQVAWQEAPSYWNDNEHHSLLLHYLTCFWTSAFEGYKIWLLCFWCIGLAINFGNDRIFSVIPKNTHVPVEQCTLSMAKWGWSQLRPAL